MLGKEDKTMSNPDSSIRNLLCKTLLKLFVIAWAILVSKVYDRRHYLGWTKYPFTILTDHANLLYYKTPKKLNRWTARWHADLQEYDFVIKHVPGKINTPADELSWPPNADQGQDDNKNQTLLKPELFIKATDSTPTKATKWRLMALVHDHPTAGHPGRDETIRKATQIHSWVGKHQWISNYIKGCANCQQNKIIIH